MLSKNKINKSTLKFDDRWRFIKQIGHRDKVFYLFQSLNIVLKDYLSGGKM